MSNHVNTMPPISFRPCYPTGPIDASVPNQTNCVIYPDHKDSDHAALGGFSNTFSQ